MATETIYDIHNPDVNENTVELNGKIFPIRILNVAGIDGAIIGTEALNNSIMTPDGSSYTSKEAELVDNQILFYASEEEFKLTDEDLTILITNQIN
ncbi:MAG: hypothetical protein EZS26_000975 [Candidatus Ordinivivax streblomastigis]|uniref:Uncharacterized protein n=1 Tax=Candidatus Ordinivivax streblomastigis TaxID=2540710 RepID=A0A5M8P2V5_9BACT|nr:MAG: hypothetical protein EZS26_000975 [Candidatus Ordinivivax streblomastigis]